MRGAAITSVAHRSRSPLPCGPSITGCRGEALSKLHGLRVNKRATPVVLAVELADGSVVTFGPNPSAAPLNPLGGEQATRGAPSGPRRTHGPSRTRPSRRVLAGDRLDHHSRRQELWPFRQPRTPCRCAATTRLDRCVPAVDAAARRTRASPDPAARLQRRTNLPVHTPWCSPATGHAHKRSRAMLDEREAFDTDSPCFFLASPVAYGLKMAEQQGVSWLILARGSQLRLYPARIDLGVGRKGLAGKISRSTFHN